MFGLSAAIPIAGAVLGGLAGGQANRTSTNSSTTTAVNLRNINDINKGRSTLEATTDQSQNDLYAQLQALLNQGPGAAQVSAGLQAQTGYGDIINQQLQSGGLPNQGQISQAQDYASQIFAPQRLGLQQAFGDQNIAQQRLAARLGRGGNDPVLQAKLGQEQTRQQAMLQAQQGAFGAEQAMNAPQRQLQLAEALANVRGGLASQAFSNRQSMLQMGNALAASERKYRLDTAGRTSNTTGSESGGGGMAGAISGGLAGIGGLAGGLSKFQAFNGILNPQPTPKGG
jgi:hypothetical protein